PPPPPPPPVEAPPGAFVLAMGGLGSSPGESKAAARAVDAATRALVSGASAFDAAVAGVMELEDEPSLNAGVGSYLPLDADEPEMDAAAMSSDGRFGAVCALTGLKNPIAVAARVADTPHLLLCGHGAERFAFHQGFAPFDTTTDARRAERDALRGRLLADPDGALFAFLQAGEASGEGGAGHGGEGGAHASQAAPVVGAGGAPAASPPEEGGAGAEPSEAEPTTKHRPPGLGSDAVAVVVRAADGTYAAAASSGGPAARLRGRVGDVAVVGGALYVGPKGAVALSSEADRRSRDQLARRVYQKLAEGMLPDAAAAWARRAVGDEALALVLVSGRGERLETTKKIAWALRSEAGVESGQPPPPPPPAPRPAGSASVAPSTAPAPAVAPSAPPASSATREVTP
ncbi:MAG: isoaspartyl peptidase/L-asparaginase, partial [Myxococcales bacterium]|nr:isoaspartyl peptidase/L-asparaginase [Myxococcales bacterium]